MGYLSEFGVKTSLRVFGGGAEEGARWRDSHYDWLKVAQDTDNDIEIAALIWSEGFKELFPEKEFMYLQVSQTLRELIKKADLLGNQANKITKLNLSLKDLKKKFLEIAVIKFLANLKLAVNEYPEYFEAVEENTLVEELITVNKVFRYIEANEKRGKLDCNIFPQANRQLDRWRKGGNIRVDSLLKIKEQMLKHGVDHKRINTYILLIYICNVIKVEDEKDVEVEDNSEGIDWEMLIEFLTPLILYHSEEITNFFREQRKNKTGE